MNQKRVEKLQTMAQIAGIDVKILPYKQEADNEVRDFMIKQHNVDLRIHKLEYFIKEGEKRSQNEIRSEIKKLLAVLNHTFAIDHSISVDKALEAFNLMSENDRTKILPTIEKIENIRQKINDIAKNVNAEKICKECEGGCCGRIIETSFSEMDFFYMFFVITEQGAGKIWKILNMPDEGGHECRFKSNDGCVIPKQGRPYFCRSYYCENIPKIGGEISYKYEKKLQKYMGILQKKLKKLGFDLSLNSQF